MEGIRRSLFNKYAQNFKEILDLYPNFKRSDKLFYMCPLCLKLFTEEHLDINHKNCLTLEHIPPSSVGGKECILTCKICNNVHGSKFDSHLNKRLNIKKITELKQISKNLNVNFKINNKIDSNGYLEVTNGKYINFIIQSERTNPIYHNEIKDLFSGNQGGFEVGIRVEAYNENKLKISLLRAAYLKTFKELGYAYVLNSNNVILRKMIMDYDSKQNPAKGVFLSSKEEKFKDLSIIKYPENLQCYAVGLKISLDGVEEYYNVFLPGGKSDSLLIYQELYKLKDLGKNKITLDLLALSGKDYINGTNKFFALEYWSDQYKIFNLKIL